jgi:hypothetical protein
MNVEQRKARMRHGRQLIVHAQYVDNTVAHSEGGCMPVATKTEQRPKVAKTRGFDDGWVPQSTWQRITDKAYELYEQRGRREGYAIQDWLDAEHLVMEEIYESH